MNRRTGQIVSLLALLLTIYMNYLANALPINGKLTGQLSDVYQNKFVPAGITFAIWGLIYLSLLVYVLYPFFRKNDDNDNTWASTDKAFLLSSLGNISWLLFWHYEMVLLSTAAMLTLLQSLVHMWKQHRATGDMSFARWAPVSLYLGWISVATIANFTILFVKWGFDGGVLGETTWAIILMTVAFSLGLFFSVSRKDYIYPLVLVWAFLGIGIKQMETDVMVWIMAITYFVFTLVFVVAEPIKRLLRGAR